MNGGKNPVREGDYLLLERITPDRAGSITGSTVVIERQAASGDDQYLLRVVTKDAAGRYILKAANPDYEDMEADESMRTLARLRAVLDPLMLAIGQLFPRDEIPALFGHEFNPGNWRTGHVVLKEPHVHVLLVTLNEQDKDRTQRYHGYFLGGQMFHWQSQNATTPTSKLERELVCHERMGIPVHLFVRERNLDAGNSAPFRYMGRVRYKRHERSAPIKVIWRLID